MAPDPEKVPLLPPETVMSSAEKPVTVSEKVKKNVTGPVAMPGVLSLMVRLGGVVSLKPLLLLLLVPIAMLRLAEGGLLPPLTLALMV